jgi:nucleoside-diphosphate-sugar epimerase
VRRALVTGSSGFLGRHLTQALLDRGYDVDRCDLADGRRRLDVLRHLPSNRRSYDLAIHAAAFVKGRAAIDGQRTFLGAYNLQLDATFFQWALRERPRHVVYLSSSSVYPAALQTHEMHMRMRESLVDLRRDEMHRPDATYGFTKLVGERLALELSDEVTGVSVHVVRPFSGYGADQDPDYPFGAFLHRAGRRADPFEVWGNGRQVRDWVHVDDVVGATLAVVDADYRRPVNVCTGHGTDFTRLARLFTEEAGYAPYVQALPVAPSGVEYRVGDPTRMRELYTPKISIEEGVRRALAP